MSEVKPIPSISASKKAPSRLPLVLVALICIAMTGFSIWFFVFRESEPKNDMERLQGDWRISVVFDDKARETDNAIRVTGDRWEYVTTTMTKAYRVTLNESTNPRQIELDLLDTAGLRGAPVKMHGIYAFEGNQSARVLVAPASDPRPTTLDDPNATIWRLIKVRLDEESLPKK